MPSLEDEIEALTQLDEYRVQSAKRRDEGRKALAAWNCPWGSSNAPVLEQALAIRALLGHAGDDAGRRIADAVESLIQLPTAAAFASKPDEMPVLRAAR